MREKLTSFTGPALLGIAGVGVAAVWISLLFFVIGPLSRS
jgi:hypothetical protein